MARYSQSREENIEVKYLCKVWSEVDKNISLPPTLTGKALLPRLEGIEHPRPVSRKIRFSPQIFSWKSGVTYAAALVLIVALSSLIGRNRPPSIVEGQISPEEIGLDARAARPDSYGALLPETAPDDDTPDAGTAQPDAQANIHPAALSETEAESDSPPVEVGASDEPVQEAVGGQNPSILLTEAGGYTYTYRYNDQSDPHKEGIPITVNVMDTATGELAFEIDIAEMQTIENYFLYEGTLAFVGNSLEGGSLLLQAFSLPEGSRPALALEHRQQGSYLDARLYKNVIHLFTYAKEGTDPGCESQVLPDSTGSDLCIVSALDLDTMQMRQKAFSGAGADLSLYNLNAYIQYEGTKTEENEQGLYVAHIRLDGVEIELRGEDDPAE